MYSVIEERNQQLQEIIGQCFPRGNGGNGNGQTATNYKGSFEWSSGRPKDLPVKSAVKECIENDPGKGARSNVVMSVVNALVKADVKRSDIFKIFEEYPIGIKWRKEHRSSVKWLDRHIEKAWSKRAGKKADTSTCSSKSFPFTDFGNAERFAAQHGENVRFCHTWGKWLIWDEKRWAIDETNRIFQLAKRTVRQMYAEAAKIEDDDQRKAASKHARASEASGRIQAMLSLAETEQAIAITANQLDADPWLLNVLNCTLNLRTQSQYQHRREDLITKIAPVVCDPDATCPRWLKFLSRIMADRQRLIEYLQRLIGYFLTGDTREKCLPVAWGIGDNGKTIFTSTIGAMLGDYAMETPVQTLMITRNEGIPNDIARLKGARLVTASEGERGQKLAESLIKRLTGGDQISARFLHQEWFQFTPEFKIILSTNHRPVIQGGDNAIWNRIHLIPFEVIIPKAEQIPRTVMLEKLRQEWPGILKWAVEGCMLWLEEGLEKPEEIEQATENYRADSDIIGGFISDTCLLNPLAECTKAELRKAYENWCAANKEAPLSTRDFKSILTERGIKDCKVGHKSERGWRGIGFKKCGHADRCGHDFRVFSYEEKIQKNYPKNASANVRNVRNSFCGQCANFEPNKANNGSHGHCIGIPPDGDKLRFPNVEVDCSEFRERGEACAD